MAAAVLDAASFPHIIDLIFDNAPAASLLALRVNKAWNRRAEALLFHHISITETEVEEWSAYPHGVMFELKSVGRGDLGIIKSSHDLAFPLNFEPTFLRSTAVIDVTVYDFEFGVSRVLQHCAPGVTFRCGSRCSLFRVSSLQPQCIVLFADDTMKLESFHVGYFQDYNPEALEAGEKLVMHVWRGGWSNLANEHCGIMRGVSHLTLVIHPWHIQAAHDQSSPRISSRERLEDTAHSNMGILIDLLVMGWASCVPTTVVGFDFSEFAALNPEIGDLHTFVMRRFSDMQADYFEYLFGDNFSDSSIRSENVPDATALPRFLTLDEYRAEVGQAQYDIEMNQGAVACPRSKQTM